MLIPLSQLPNNFHGQWLGVTCDLLAEPVGDDESNGHNDDLAEIPSVIL